VGSWQTTPAAYVIPFEEALKTQAVQHLKRHGFIAQSVHVLKDESANHPFGRKRRTSATRSASARCGPVEFGGQRLEVDVLIHLSQHVAQAIQLGLTFLRGA
jgi:hypothetical protein